MKSNIENRIKIIALVVCTFLTITSFSTATTYLEYNEYKKPEKILDESYNNFDSVSHNNLDNIERDNINSSFFRHGKEDNENWNLWEPDHLPEEELEFEPGSILIKFRSNIFTSEGALAEVKKISKISQSSFADVLSAQPVFSKLNKNGEKNNVYGLDRWVKITVENDTDISQESLKWKNSPFVEDAQPNYIMTLYLEPNDPYYYSSGSWGQDYPDLWGLHRISASAAWDVTTGSYDVVVAVVDTGVDYNHEDIHANMWINEDEIPDNGLDDDDDGFIDNIYGADFAYDDGDPMDRMGHGTHCAGTIGALGNNAKGVVGVNWQASIMAVKGLGDVGYGYIEDLAAALVWATDQGAQVLSNSWGPGSQNPSNPLIENAVNYAYGHGCVILFAAGNNNDDVRYYSPANMDETIAVAATDHEDIKSDFSNWGEKIDVCAPGGDSRSTGEIGRNILSLRAEFTDIYGDGTCVVGERYYRARGTSMACPHVAGLAALIYALNPYYSNAEVAEIISSTADNIDALNPGYEGLLGGGRINASRALQQFIHNVGVHTLDVPSHIKSNELIRVNATIVNNGNSSETNVLVSFRVNGLEIDNITIPFFESFTNEQVSFAWTPTPEVYNVTINVKIPNVIEDYYLDNEKNQTVIVGVYNIDTGECFETIQQALDDPDTLDGHSILVPSKIYYENVIINKNISLIGENRDTAIIEGNESASTNSVIHVLGTNFVNVTGFTIRDGTYGVSVESSLNTTIMESCIIDNIEVGIHLRSSDNIYVIKNIIFNNTQGVHLTDFSCNNLIMDNELIGNYEGLILSNSTSNRITVNEIIGNYEGLIIGSGSSNNIIYNNNFNNTQNAFDNGNDNKWDNGYRDRFRLCGGNWWSDYNGSDEYSGPYQNQPGSDGIGDIPYNISGVGGGRDRYPLMEPWAGPLPSTIYVDNNNTMGPWYGTREHPYQHIQDGIDNAVVHGDMVFVLNGTYHEQVTVNRQHVSLIGEDRNSTVIDAGGIGDVVSISANGVEMSGFTIQNSGNLCCPEEADAGVNVRSDYNTISENTIINNGKGIYLFHSSNNIISGNNINNNEEYGIYLKEVSSNNDISGNNITYNQEGGVCIGYGSAYNVVSENNISYNSIHGIYVGFSLYFPISPRYNSIFDNNITENGYGIFTWGSYTNNITRNIITNHIRGGIFTSASYIDITYSNVSNNVISRNTISNNDEFGIFCLWGVTNSIICRNTIVNNNEAGIIIEFSSNNNIISENIIANSYDGIFLLGSSHTRIIDNTFLSCGILLDGDVLSDWNTHTMENNSINGRPLYYYKNSCNMAVPSDAAQVILANCSDFIVQNLTLNGSSTGIELAFSSNNIIHRNTITNTNYHGMYLMSSSDNSILNNDISNNKIGILLAFSCDNIISENNISNSSRIWGDIILFYYSSRNVISMNTLNHSGCGVYLSTSSTNNSINRNTIAHQIGGIYQSPGFTSNIISENILRNNNVSIYQGGFGFSNTISGNVIMDNTEYGIYLASIGTDVTKNNINNSTIGIYIDTESGYHRIFENTIEDNTKGIIMDVNSIGNSILYHNNLINNTQNAYDECTNTWYNETLQEGNYWDDFENNPGYPDVYEIPGGDNVDLYPLAVPYHPLPDLIISDFTATYNGRIVQLTATVKNNGTADVDIPFQVSFSRSPTYTSPKEIHYNSIIDIGTVEIPSLMAGETAEATIYWKFLPEVNIIQVFADSTLVVEESNETNNKASITI